MQEQGKIIRIEDGTAYVQICAKPRQVCQKCHACRFTGDGNFVLTVPSEKGLGAGQTVLVDVPESTPLRSAGVVLGLPLVVLMAGIVVGSSWPWLQESLNLSAESCGLLLGGLAALIVFSVAIMCDRRLRRA
ncbi:MAG: SoxR reducing system RseC family protein, partial [Phycisphaerae bacterium]|nr:SoxR reducing system RseC family protein [Phycisphaerae bacterium]